jgi:MFS family permease
MTQTVSPAEDMSPTLVVTLTVLAVSSLTIMANATISPSLPGLAAAFADVPGIETLSGLVLSLPSLAIILTAAAFGFLADKVSRRKLLAFAMVLYAVGGASGFFASSMAEILVGRVILGVGVAGTLTIATMLSADLWTGRARVQFMGRQAAAISAGGAAFLVLGGVLAEMSWRAPFLIYLLALPIAVAAWRLLPEKQPTDASTGHEKHPVQWRLIAPIAALAFFTMVAFYIIPTRLPFLMVDLGITSTTLSGIAIAAVTATSIVSALLFSRIRAVLQPLQIYALSYFAMALGYGLIASSSGFVQIIGGTLIVGLGLGMSMPNQNSWLMAVVDEQTRGRAAGILTTFVFAGQFAAPLIAGGLAAFMSIGTVFAVFAAALAIVAVLLLASGVAGRPKRKTEAAV